ncbi:MAG: EscU/YscU/HrcU family type III secretion system export apparatus switch protein [Planctomycetes bacterium]|nr:EscU/YscU/HrcU family type III secretion system export apparatus switch protein [Planctomycetota bacterium]
MIPPQSREVAIALGYRPGEDLAPRVFAQGEGRVAERIRAIARERGIPVHEDATLAELLRHVPLEEEIPPSLYPAVAEVFAFLIRLARGAGMR